MHYPPLSGQVYNCNTKVVLFLYLIKKKQKKNIIYLLLNNKPPGRSAAGPGRPPGERDPLTERALPASGFQTGTAPAPQGAELRSAAAGRPRAGCARKTGSEIRSVYNPLYINNVFPGGRIGSVLRPSCPEWSYPEPYLFIIGMRARPANRSKARRRRQPPNKRI